MCMYILGNIVYIINRIKGSSSSSNSIYLYTKINMTFYNVFYCLSNSLQVWVPG